MPTGSQRSLATIPRSARLTTGFTSSRSLPVECLRFGVACGAESTHHFGAGIIDPGRVERLLSEVESERLELGAEIG